MVRIAFNFNLWTSNCIVQQQQQQPNSHQIIQQNTNHPVVLDWHQLLTIDTMNCINSQSL